MTHWIVKNIFYGCKKPNNDIDIKKIHTVTEVHFKIAIN